MTTLAEMVEEEAAAAEAEEEAASAEPEDDEPEAEPEDEPEPEALAPIGPEEIRKAERAREGQRKRLAAILGDDYVAHECIFCSGLGFNPEPPPPGASFLVVETEDGLAFQVEPPPPEIPLLQAPDKAMCPECDGWGEVLSGSKAAHGMVTPCSKCAGNGWVITPRDEPYVAGAPPVTAPPPAAYIPPSVQAGEDGWGRPPGHQHWGVPPAMIPG